MKKVLPVCAAILFLFEVSAFPRLSDAAAPGPAGAAPQRLMPQEKAPPKPQGMPLPAQPQGIPQAAPPAAKEPTVKPLPLVRKAALAVQKPALANVDLRPDVVATIQTEPPVSNFGMYNPYGNMGKPLKVTAIVENAGITKADKVAIGFFFSRMPGVPMKQNAWEYHYTVDLGPGEVVSYPFDILFHSTMVTFTVNGEFAGDEKYKGNNTSQLYVKF